MSALFACSYPIVGGDHGLLLFLQKIPMCLSISSSSSEYRNGVVDDIAMPRSIIVPLSDFSKSSNYEYRNGDIPFPSYFKTGFICIWASVFRTFHRILCG